MNQLVSSRLHFVFNSALVEHSQKCINGVQFSQMGLDRGLPADLEGCSRAKDFDTKGVHIEKTRTLGSVNDGGPE